ncbi:class I glutamine amidotransferase-like protein [Cylindrobasidium torrendii FP15055 ss-10]|uniref:D-lactate dehydratase n=1 Tax=Cylindrobasidium torrendii FP15055 ss-10 TaxID=1314674 RepID=A0A0D7BVS3_9AGAR|nr:class I glutamine amidotransferase-like protein [Cylindrobasidium torrendii FP15055 ss-10]
MSKSSILFVYTSCDTGVNGKPTGWYLPEAAHPYYILAPHVNITFASPKGANPPVDEGSVKTFTDDESQKFLKDPEVKKLFENTKKISEVDAKDYDAIFYVGGHGPCIDLAVDEANIKLAGEFYQSGKITAAVCHGPAALANVVDAAGKSIFDGRQFTVFSNVEETQVDGFGIIPWSVEDKLKERGGKFVSTEPWGVKTVVDGNLYTGQNPASAGPLGKVILEALQK